MSTIYTDAQLSTMMDALTLRVNLIDGQNLVAPLSGQIQQLRALIAGLKKTLGQVNLGYQAQEAILTKQVAALSALVATMAGPAAPPTS